MIRKLVDAPDGTRIVYADHGPAASRDVVVLVHGVASAGEQFADDAVYFSGLGRRVLVPDLRGHGQSRVSGSLGADRFTIATMAHDLKLMLEHAGVETTHWVGNSLGGIVGLDLLVRMPQRFASFATFGTAYRLSLPAAAALGFPLAYALGPRIAGAVTARVTTKNREARAVIDRCIAAFDPRVGKAVAQNVRRYDLIANALAYAGPILMLRGGADLAVNQALRQTLPIMSGRPNFRLVDLPTGGHCANLDASDAFRAALLAFWAEAEARSA